MTDDHLRKLLRDCVLASYQELAARGPLGGVGLITDEDLRTIYLAGFLEKEKFWTKAARFVPGEWRLSANLSQECEESLMARVVAGYETEDIDDDISPDEADKLRGWKRDVFRVLVEATAVLREQNSSVFLIAASHDPGPVMARWISEGVMELNGPEIYEEWKKAWKKAYGYTAKDNVYL